MNCPFINEFETDLIAMKASARTCEQYIQENEDFYRGYAAAVEHVIRNLKRCLGEGHGTGKETI